MRNAHGQRRIGILLLLLAFLVGSSLSSAVVAAQTETPGESTPESVDSPDEEVDAIWFVMTPDGQENGEYFDIEADPGEVVELTVMIGNGSAIPVEARIYAANAHSGINGGFVVEAFGTAPEGLTRWIDYPEVIHSFEPGETIERTFTIEIPPDAEPGEYISGLAIETAEAQPMPGDAPLSVKYRLLLPVLVTVPGDLEAAFSVSNVTMELFPQASVIRGTIENLGNVRVRPSGTLRLHPDSGGEDIELPLEMESVYAYDITIFEILIEAALPADDYLVSVQLSDENTKSTASLDRSPVTIVQEVVETPLTISAATVAPMPSSDNVVFVQVDAEITNTGAPINGGSVELRVLRDGEQIDAVSIGSSLSLPNGVTSLSQAYVPESGEWESGHYSFSLVLSVADFEAGVEVEAFVYDVAEEIIIE